VHAVVTTRADGNQRPIRWREKDLTNQLGEPEATAHDPSLVQRQIAGGPWTFVHQIHSANVVRVHSRDGLLEQEADGLVSSASNVRLAMLGADCSLIGLASTEGIIGIVHAGWRGLFEGVIEKTVLAMRELGAASITGVVGPTIGPECYEFSAVDLQPLVEKFGEGVHVRREDHTDALDLRTGVDLALGRAGVTDIVDLGACTACDPRFYSWRADQDEARHALVIWRAGEHAEGGAQ
jgi:hypothetical protein